MVKFGILDKEITMSKALIVYTQGSEDIESTAVLDILKRDGFGQLQPKFYQLVYTIKTKFLQSNITI